MYKKRQKMKFFKIIPLIILFFLNIQPVKAEELSISKGEVLTLEQCIDIAVNRNPNIDLAKNTTKIYESRVGQVKSGYLPQINLSSGYNRLNPIANVGIDRDNNNYSGNIGVNQLIYDFGKTPTKVKIQGLNLESSKYDVNDTVVQIAYSVKQAYYAALISKINKDIQAQSINQHQQHLKQAKAFFEAGTKPKIDVTTAEVNLSNAKLNYIKANNAYKNALASLNNAMGMPDAPEYEIDNIFAFKHLDNNKASEVEISGKPGNLTKKESNTVLKSGISKYNIMSNLSFKKYDITFEDALKTAYESRSDLKAVITREESSKASIKLAKKEYFPVLSGAASYGIGGREYPLDSGWSFGANVTVPIFNGFLTKKQIDEARASLSVVKSSVEILKQNIYLEVQQAYINLTETEKRIPVIEMTINQSKEYFDLANGRYNVGVGNSIELQDAEINYNNAQLSYAQALYDYSIARSNLEKAMGVK